MDAAWHQELDQLAEGEYKQLKRCLQNLKQGQMQYLSNAAATVNRGLNWPLLRASDQLVLSMLSGPLSRAEEEGTISPEILDVCIEAVDLLLCRASESEISDWAGRMRNVSSDVLVSWLNSTASGVVDDWEL